MVCNVLIYNIIGDICYGLNLVFFFFFKQKTAYEMRISDWSSDVCSSDLDEKEPVVGSSQNGPQTNEQKHTRFHKRGGMEIGRNGRRRRHEIGRASCRERVCQYV